MGNFSHMVACRSSSKKYMKNGFTNHFDKNSPWTHTRLEFDLLGIASKLVKCGVHLFRRRD
jgi:hypothetical protein